MKIRNKFILRFLITLAAITVALPAAAHHPMGGATPGTLLEGLLSGFGHPIIGFDHLLFIVAIGIACYCFGQRIATLAMFLLGALAGTLLHLRLPDVPYADAWVAASLIVLGALFFRRSDFLKSKAAIVLFALSGIAHGYAYGEAIVGAEATPLLAYLTGFTLVQFAIALCGFAVARYVTSKKPGFEFLKAAGGALAATGAGFLVFTFAS
ncbi:MAG: HupE/UreJ family protein [Burkholderiales bacterium]